MITGKRTPFIISDIGGKKKVNITFGGLKDILVNIGFPFFPPPPPRKSRTKR